MKRLSLALTLALAGSQLAAFELPFKLPIPIPIPIPDDVNRVFQSPQDVCNIGRGKDDLARRMARSLCAGSVTTVTTFVGKKFRDLLSEPEQTEVAKATYKTLDTGKRQELKTASGATVTTEVTPVPPDAAASIAAPTPDTAASQVATAEKCNSVKQTMVTSDNQRFEEVVTACKKGEKWTVVT